MSPHRVSRSRKHAFDFRPGTGTIWIRSIHHIGISSLPFGERSLGGRNINPTAMKRPQRSRRSIRYGVRVSIRQMMPQLPVTISWQWGIFSRLAASRHVSALVFWNMVLALGRLHSRSLESAFASRLSISAQTTAMQWRPHQNIIRSISLRILGHSATIPLVNRMPMISFSSTRVSTIVSISNCWFIVLWNF